MDSRPLGRNSVALLISIHDGLGKRDTPIPGGLKEQTGFRFAAGTRPHNLWMVWAKVKGIYVCVELCSKHLIHMLVKAAHIPFSI